MAWEFLARNGEAETLGAHLIPQDFLGRRRWDQISPALMMAGTAMASQNIF